MKQFFKSELGRSMVEMLGVLALIGVLSIGAVADYSYAITKWKANETIADLHVCALEYTRQLAMAKKLRPIFSSKILIWAMKIPSEIRWPVIRFSMWR